MTERDAFLKVLADNEDDVSHGVFDECEELGFHWEVSPVYPPKSYGAKAGKAAKATNANGAPKAAKAARRADWHES